MDPSTIDVRVIDAPDSGITVEGSVIFLITPHPYSVRPTCSEQPLRVEGVECSHGPGITVEGCQVEAGWPLFRPIAYYTRGREGYTERSERTISMPQILHQATHPLLVLQRKTFQQSE